MSQVEIVRKDGTKLGEIDEVQGTIKISEEWAQQPKKTAEPEKKKESEDGE